jgi:hypothetical protein
MAPSAAAQAAAQAAQNAQASAASEGTRKAFAQGPQSLINPTNGYLGISGRNTGTNNLGSA